MKCKVCGGTGVIQGQAPGLVSCCSACDGKGFIKQTDCLTEVKSGTADFAVLDAQLAKSYCGKGNYADLQIVDDLSSDVEYYAIGFKKGSDLTAKVNEQLVKLAEDGTIKKIAEEYEVLNTTILDYSDQVK